MAGPRTAVTGMRILVCLSATPTHPLDGFGLLASELVTRLARSDDVRVLSLAPDRPIVPAIETGVVDTRARHGGARLATAVRGVVAGRSLASDGRVERMRGAVEQALATSRPDVALVASGRLAGLGGLFTHTGVPAVLLAVDARHLNVRARRDRATGPRRWLLDRELHGVIQTMCQDYPRFDEVVAVTPEDAQAITAVAPDVVPHAIPNGVDTQRFAPDPTATPDPALLVFTGTMDYAPNVDAAVTLATEILPRVRAQVPEARLALVGRRPHPDVAALGAEPGVTVTGEVDDVVPWLNRAAVMVCAMWSGTGVKNKLLEAMACARPCVVTPLALQGIAAVPGTDVVVGEDVEQVTAGVVGLLREPVRAARLGTAARVLVERGHSWDSVAQRYRDVLAASAAVVRATS